MRGSGNRGMTRGTYAASLVVYTYDDARRLARGLDALGGTNQQKADRVGVSAGAIRKVYEAERDMVIRFEPAIAAKIENAIASA